MDQSISDSDISLSPSQILERLHVLRQLQLMQRGKLQKHQIKYQDSPESSTNISEIVSHFSNSPSYNTFRSLLGSPQKNLDFCKGSTPSASNCSQKVKEGDLIDGVSVLNVSQESEFINNSPISSTSRVSELSQSKKNQMQRNVSKDLNIAPKKHISLDEMPILSPRKDFETLVLEKLEKETNIQKTTLVENDLLGENKKASKSFLKKGEGMARFGLRKNNLIIQNTKSLPWLQKNTKNNDTKKTKFRNITNEQNINVQILVPKPDVLNLKHNVGIKPKVLQNSGKHNKEEVLDHDTNQNNIIITADDKKLTRNFSFTKDKHPLNLNRGSTWAAVLSKEQNDFLKELKQSAYYKSFVSPSKSILSDTSCNESLHKIRQEKEHAEQNMFEFLESKVLHESFDIKNSFIQKFLRNGRLECSGESTPLIMQKCLAKNPDLLQIQPNVRNKIRNENSHIDVETCNSEYTDCCSEACSCISSCSTCKTIEETKQTSLVNNKKVARNTDQKKEKNKDETDNIQVTQDNDKRNDCQYSTGVNDSLKIDMIEMNAKLVATSELLKDRLHELEDEIEIFRKENINLTKMREEIDLERQKFYAEKTMFEQKFNEEKILSEYYLAEEKEKLTKQKQTYEKYLREIRGQINKKDKGDIAKYKKEISDLKDEIKLKDAKSTATIARLRNQIKFMEKERNEMKDEIDKLKKEKQRIEHSNDMTRRLTNIKYLEEINRKLSNMNSNNHMRSDAEVDNRNFKAFEIERQSRSRVIQSKNKNVTRPRAKSVPNLKVTSRYAKYFSQRDVQSEIEQKKGDIVQYSLNSGLQNKQNTSSDDESIQEQVMSNQGDDIQDQDESRIEDLYMEEFHRVPLKGNISNITNSNLDLNEKNECKENSDEFFIHPYTTTNSNKSKSPNSIASNRSSNSQKSLTTTSNYSQPSMVSVIPKSNNSLSTIKSPISILSNHKSGYQAIINLDKNSDTMVVSPEPPSRASITKSNLNPTEIIKPDRSKEIRFPNGNVKYISQDGDYSKFVYYNGDVKENFYNEGRIKYFYAETKTYHTTHSDGLEVLEFSDGQIEKRYKDGSTEIRLPNGSIRYFDPKNEHVREEWRFPDGAALTVAANGEQRIVFSNGQIEVHAKDHKRREFPDGTMKLVYNDGTSETRYASGRVRIKDKHGNLILDSANT